MSRRRHVLLQAGAKQEHQELQLVSKRAAWEHVSVPAGYLAELLRAAIALDKIDCITARHIVRPADDEPAKGGA